MKRYTYIATALLILAGSSTNANAADDTDMLLKDALSAAPPALRDKVTVVDWNDNVLQQGTSNYTCFPTPPQLSGTAPMCMDAAWDEQKAV